MEKIRKIDVGTLLANDSHSEFEFEDSIRKCSYMVFENVGHFDDSSRTYELNGEHCYIVSKDDLDAYMAHKESLEKTKGTPDWYLSNRIKQLEAENANLRDINKSLGERAAEVEELKERIDHLKIIQRLLAKDRGNYYKGESDAIARNYCNLKKNQEKKWSAMTEALKAKGVEVIYMGEEDEKPCVDVKIPEIDILKKELEALKSHTLDNVEIRLSCGDIVWTYCDGFSYVSSGISGMISADEISTGTVPKCSSCAHYMRGSRSADVWCHKPVSKKGPGYIRRLSAEEAEGPACADFKAKE